MPLRRWHKYVAPLSDTSGRRSSVSGASLTGRARYSYSSIDSEISSRTDEDAASQPRMGSKLVSAIENATRRTLAGSAAAAAMLQHSRMAARQRLIRKKIDSGGRREAWLPVRDAAL